MNNDNSDKTIGEARKCKEKGGGIGTDTVLVRIFPLNLMRLRMLMLLRRILKRLWKWGNWRILRFFLRILWLFRRRRFGRQR